MKKIIILLAISCTLISSCAKHQKPVVSVVATDDYYYSADLAKQYQIQAETFHLKLDRIFVNGKEFTEMGESPLTPLMKDAVPVVLNVPKNKAVITHKTMDKLKPKEPKFFDEENSLFKLK